MCMATDKKIIQLRQFDATDYEAVAAWWSGHGWNPVPQAMLPRLGVIAFFCSNKIEDAAAGWLYMDNSVGVCMLEWLVSNPDCAPRDVVRALGHVCDYLTAEAQACGYRAMLTTCRQEGLAKFHERRGFARTDENMIHLVKPLC